MQEELPYSHFKRYGKAQYRDSRGKLLVWQITGIGSYFKTLIFDVNGLPYYDVLVGAFLP